MAKKFLALLLLLLATPAFAATYVGTVPASGFVAVPIPPLYGHYQLSFAFSRPMPFDLTIHLDEYYDIFNAQSGDYITGDVNHYYDKHEDQYAKSGSVQWWIERPYYYEYSGIVAVGFYTGVDAFFQFRGDLDKPVTYRVDITAVPEPAQWALMIGGFGLAGAALRRRNRARTSVVLAA